MTGKTVLVIDDDRAFLIQLNQALKDAGYRVLEATDLADGMAMLERLHAEIDLTAVGSVTSVVAAFHPVGEP